MGHPLTQVVRLWATRSRGGSDKRRLMNFKTYFRGFSYATVAVATLALFLAGGVSGVLAILFWFLQAVAWKLEDTKWQFSERTGLIVVLARHSAFYS